MECTMRKKEIIEAFVRALMSLHKGAMTKVKVGTYLSDKYDVNALALAYA